MVVGSGEWVKESPRPLRLRSRSGSGCLQAVLSARAPPPAGRSESGALMRRRDSSGHLRHVARAVTSTLALESSVTTCQALLRPSGPSSRSRPRDASSRSIIRASRLSQPSLQPAYDPGAVRAPCCDRTWSSVPLLLPPVDAAQAPSAARRTSSCYQLELHQVERKERHPRRRRDAACRCPVPSRRDSPTMLDVGAVGDVGHSVVDVRVPLEQETVTVFGTCQIHQFDDSVRSALTATAMSPSDTSRTPRASAPLSAMRRRYAGLPAAGPTCGAVALDATSDVPCLFSRRRTIMRRTEIVIARLPRAGLGA